MGKADGIKISGRGGILCDWQEGGRLEWKYTQVIQWASLAGLAARNYVLLE